MSSTQQRCECISHQLAGYGKLPQETIVHYSGKLKEDWATMIGSLLLNEFPNTSFS
jgi:hypothetical protein